MNIFSVIPLSLNSWLVTAVGLALIIFSAYHGIFFYDRVFSVGLLAFGFGMLFLGLTEGFTDPTPRGKFLYRVAIVAFLIGIPVVIKGAYDLASSEW